MVQHASEIGANAVIGMRYDANEIMNGVTEVLAYGTAVVVQAVERARGFQRLINRIITISSRISPAAISETILAEADLDLRICTCVVPVAV